LLWAACCMGFYAFLRSGEFTCTTGNAFDPTLHITPEDIAVDSREKPTMMRIHIKQSKTDQLRQGINLFIGATDNDIFPITAVLSYLAARGSQSGPLFVWRDGRPLTRAQLVAMLRATLAQAGVDYTRYAGHSFRIGAATTAAAKGMSESMIQTLGRWASDSFKRYIRIPRSQLALFSKQLAAD